MDIILERKTANVLRKLIKIGNEKGNNNFIGNPENIYNDFFKKKMTFEKFNRSLLNLHSSNYIKCMFGDSKVINLSVSNTAVNYFSSIKYEKRKIFFSSFFFPSLVAIVVALVTTLITLYFKK